MQRHFNFDEVFKLNPNNINEDRCNTINNNDNNNNNNKNNNNNDDDIDIITSTFFVLNFPYGSTKTIP